MIDPRFYAVTAQPTAAQIAEWTGGTVVGDPARTVSSVASAAAAVSGDLSFLEDTGGDALKRVAASVLLVRQVTEKALPAGVTAVTLAQPRAAFARAARGFLKLVDLEPGQPAIHPETRLAQGVTLEPGVVIGRGAALGRNVRVGANTVIGPGVQIGNDTGIGRNVSIRCALIGDGVTILSGAVIGDRGFGLVGDTGGPALLPHYGRVIIQNGCSIGSNSCVDRGFLEDTVLGERVHIDNLCHVGHNVKVGSRSVMAAFAGVSGSSVVGEDVSFGGRVGLKDHITVGKGAQIAAGSAVLQDVKAGETVAGYPAKPIRSWMRELAWLALASQKRPAKDE